MSYEQRLNALNTESLELRRLELDLVLMFKSSRGYTAIDNKFINFRTDSHTRGDFKVFKPHCKVNARAFSLAARYVNCWNALPNSVSVLHHSALLSVYCVHVLVISHRFYVLNVIFKCYFYTLATVGAC